MNRSNRDGNFYFFFFSLKLVGLSYIPSLNLFFEILNEIDLQMIVFFLDECFELNRSLNIHVYPIMSKYF